MRFASEHFGVLLHKKAALLDASERPTDRLTDRQTRQTSAPPAAAVCTTVLVMVRGHRRSSRPAQFQLVSMCCNALLPRLGALFDASACTDRISGRLVDLSQQLPV